MIKKHYQNDKNSQNDKNKSIEFKIKIRCFYFFERKSVQIHQNQEFLRDKSKKYRLEYIWHDNCYKYKCTQIH